MNVENVERPRRSPETSECCGGTCRLSEIRRMNREQLMDAVVTAEEALAMAESYIADLTEEPTLTEGANI